MPVDEDAEAGGRAAAWAPKNSGFFFVLKGGADVLSGEGRCIIVEGFKNDLWLVLVVKIVPTSNLKR